MSLAFDEYGRPFIIIRDQEGKSRMKVRRSPVPGLFCCCGGGAFVSAARNCQPAGWPRGAATEASR